MMTILKEIDQEFLYQTVNRNQFKKYFFENAEDGEIKEYIKNIFKNNLHNFWKRVEILLKLLQKNNKHSII